MLWGAIEVGHTIFVVVFCFQITPALKYYVGSVAEVDCSQHLKDRVNFELEPTQFLYR